MSRTKSTSGKTKPPASAKKKTTSRKSKPQIKSGAKTRAKSPAKTRAKSGAKSKVKTNASPEIEFQEALVRQTERLVVRALAPWDYEVWANAFRAFDPPKNEWDAGGIEEEDLKSASFNQMLREQTRLRNQDRFYHFGIFLKKSGRFIGATALMDISRGVFQNAYLGYWLGNIHWGQGYAREAVQATIDIAFEDLQLHRVEAGIAPKNKKSLQLARNLRMRREGLSRKRIFTGGQWRDLVLYALTSEDRGFTFEP